MRQSNQPSVSNAHDHSFPVSSNKMRSSASSPARTSRSIDVQRVTQTRPSNPSSIWFILNPPDLKTDDKRRRQKCKVPTCMKSSKGRGLCNSHGGGSYCNSPKGCTNFAVSSGKCITHGGGKRCSVEGCAQGAKANSLCWKHGGSVKCKVKGCQRGGKTGNLCWSHGGGKSCQTEKCTKVALKGGHCWAHGGGKRCAIENCKKPCASNSKTCCIHK